MARGPSRAHLTEESKVLIGKLKRAEIMPEFRAEMRNATSPLQPAVRKAARRLPSTHSRYDTESRGGSLRNAVANSIQRKMRLSARSVMVVIKQVPKGGKSNLARVLEGELLWEHPTFGHDPVVVQDPEPFFFSTIEPMIPAINRRIETVLEKFERKL